MKTSTNISVFFEAVNMFYKMYVFEGFQPRARQNGYSLAPPGTAFTYMYEIGYTCVSQLNLQKSLLAPQPKPNRKSAILN